MARQSWGQSKQLTTKSWAIVKENRYLLAFPVLGFLVSLIPLAVFWVPAAWLFATNNNIPAIVLIIVGIFANQIVIAVAIGGLVAATDSELAGGQSSVGHGIGVSITRIFPLVAWAFIQTVVNVIVGLMRGNGQSGVGDAMRNIAAAGVLALWRLITFFVVPFIVLEKVGPITAIKESSKLLKARWGLQIFGGVRIGGLIGLTMILPAIIAIIGGILLTASEIWAAGVPLFVVGVILLVIGSLLLATLRGIFSVVLFRYAKDDAVQGGFTAEELTGAVRTKA